MSAVIEKPRAKRVVVSKTTPTAPAPQASPFHGPLKQLHALLLQAYQYGDPEQESSDSDRLLATGADLALDLVETDETLANVEPLLYDIAAQIKAAMIVPGDTPSAERIALIEQAGVILKALLDDPRVLEVWSPPEQQEERRIVSANTPITEGGEIAERLVIRCSYDLEYLADAVIRLGDLSIEDEELGALARCYGARIKELNSRLMSHLDKDDMITVGDVHNTLFDTTREFKQVEVKSNG